MMVRSVARALIAAAAMTWVAACGGGGSAPPAAAPSLPPSAPPAPAPPPPAPAPTPGFPAETSAEFRRSWGLGAVNPVPAWSRGFAGDGVLVGVIDSGVELTRQDLAANISPLSTDINLARNDPNDRSADLDKHGTYVAGVIAAEFNSFGSVGVAFRSKVLSIRADIPGPCEDGCPFRSSDIAAALDYAVSNGASVVNLSLGGDNPLGPTFEAALRRAALAGVAVVASAGNEGGPNPEWPARYAANAAYLGSVVAVGALTEAGGLAGFSNRAGVAQSFYLLAPGEGVVTGCAGSSCLRVSGTSFAAPHVSGALALLKQASPGLNGAQLIQILLTAADDLGAPGTDAEFGRGRLNIGRAFQPIGPLSVPVGGIEIVPIGPAGETGAAFGDALGRPGALDTVGFDAFGRTFDVSLAGLVAPAGGRSLSIVSAPLFWTASRAAPATDVFLSPAEAAWRADADRGAEAAPANVRMGLGPGLDLALASGLDADGGAAPAAFAGLGRVGTPEISTAFRYDAGAFEAALAYSASRTLAGDGLGFRAGSVEAASLRVGYAPAQNGRIEAVVGFAREDGSVLGGVFSGALREGWGATSRFVGLAAEAELAFGLIARAGAEIGAVEPGANAMLAGAGDLTTTAFAASIEGPAGFDALERWLPGTQASWSFAISQPLRVEDGELSFRAADADEWGRRNLTTFDRPIDARPSGREIRFALGWRLELDGRFEARAEAIYRLEPGHVAAADPDAGVAVRFGWRL